MRFLSEWRAAAGTLAFAVHGDEILDYTSMIKFCSLEIGKISRLLVSLPLSFLRLNILAKKPGTFLDSN